MGEGGEPELEEKGRRLSKEETLRRAIERWGELYKHPKHRPEWCGQEEWDKRMEHVRKVVAKGPRLQGTVEPPSWEDFAAYVGSLPEGKSGWGFLRYEMLKRADAEDLRIWYEHVIVPLVQGEWSPGRLIKVAELVLLDKGKGDVSSLDFFRGIGLLQHSYKIMEWALMAGAWKKLVTVIDEEILCFIFKRSVCQSLWWARVETE
jgi:hypothetical protein